MTVQRKLSEENVFGRPPSLTALVRHALANLVPADLADDPALARPVAPAPFAAVPPATLLRLARAMPDEAERQLVRLADTLALSDAELLAAHLLLTVETDPALPRIVARLQGAGERDGPSRPTLGLLARIVGDLDLAPSPLAVLVFGDAVRVGLIVVRDAPDTPLSDRTTALGEAPLAALLGATAPPAGLRALTPPDWTIPPSWHDASASVRALLDGGRLATIVLRAGDPGEAGALAAWLCAATGRRAVLMSPHGGAWPAGNEVWLAATGGVPIVMADVPPGETLTVPGFAHYSGPLIVAAGPDGACATAHGPARIWHPPMPPRAERAALWRDALPELAEAEAVAGSLRCTPAIIHAIATRAALDAPVTAAGIAEAIRDHAAEAIQALGGLARLLSRPIADDAFVASPAIARQLSLLLARLRHREAIGDGLGPALTTGLTCGVKALLVGPSGTGKTLAAQWLATRLGKPLLLVDAGAVSSKYIGETEKNLATLFARAEAIDAILLFDEADSLFGARTDIAHASDRFANAQTNYLLQRIESFDGIALLTSNSKERFDGAFMRRLDMILDVPLPTAPERRALWRAHLGDTAVPTEEIATLAAAETLPGGHIRGAVLTASARARERGDAMTLDDLKAGIAAENAKLGRGRAPLADGA